MANPNAPFGFKVHSHGSGGTPGRGNEYTLSTAYATSLFEGDVVKTDGSGNLNIAAAGDAIVGVFRGVEWVASDGSIEFRNKWTGATAEQSGSTIRALVYDDPNTLFEAQSVGSMTAADIGQFVNIDTSVAGSAVTGKSGQMTSASGGSESQFVIVDVVQVRHGRPCRNAAGNQDLYAAGTNAIVVVKPAKHERGGSAIAVEV
jgi:hypothetical protein